MNAADARSRAFEALVGGAVVGVNRLPMLDFVVDRLARLLTASLRKFIGDNADVTIERTQPVRLQNFLDSIATPVMIAVIRAVQWDGYCLAAIDSRLIGSLVDILLGGRRNRPRPIEGRPFSSIERNFVERFASEAITRDLKRAFESVCDVDFVLERFETTPSYAAITKLSAAAVTFRAEVTMEGRAGHLDFLIPYAVLGPVRDLLAQEFVGKKQGGDTIWQSHIQAELPRAAVTIRAVIEQRQISAREVAGWRPGSVLVLDQRHDSPIELYCESVPVLRARIAEQGGWVALHIEERLLAENWPS
jgi:flagellar motor switch protein FliM